MIYKYRNIKNFLDRILAFILVIILSPIYLIIGLIIFINMGQPIIFSQRRPGYKNKIFKIYKFRTMRITYNSEGYLLPDSERITKIGNFLRSNSLDELPQLFNIVIGNMSFIGPRPLLEEYLPLYNKEQSTRHNVKPGLTCLSQINGRNSINWEKKFYFDILYVNNYSFLMDLKILLITFWKVLKKEGINSSKSNPMEIFRGN
tara:strand:+ start:829 stop:1437 length:609 start_codon:yes stop_codon:yes gene_type:complete